MFATTIIAFREFFEAFLIVSVFLGISKKLKLNREKEILIASAIGAFSSLLLASLAYFFSNVARTVLTQQRTELLESYLLVFSGIFIAYVMFSLHGVMRKSRGNSLIKAHQKLQNNAFDYSLFATIILLVIREGSEVALFSATTSLFSSFSQNMFGLLLGLGGALLIGVLSYSTFLRFQIHKVFKITEYLILLLGASLVQNGFTKLYGQTINVHLENFIRIPLNFLPDQESIAGHLIQTLTGIDREFSVVRLAIMALYIFIVYLLFLRQPVQEIRPVETLEETHTP